VHQFDPRAVVIEKWSKTPPDPKIDAAALIARVHAVHVIALFVGNHFEGQLVVVAQEQSPLAVLRYGGIAAKNFYNRKTVLKPQRHKHARHERKVERHLARVAVLEI